MKILIAVDIGEVHEDEVIVGKYSTDTNECAELNVNELMSLAHGEIISFDSIYMKYDRQDDSFFEAEFHGILER